jgi:urea transport system substrate-binding protein
MAGISQETYGTLHPPVKAQEQPSLATVPPDLDGTLGGIPACRAEPDTLSHYRILRVLGQGGMGKVYHAEDMRLGRAVALKVMLPELTTVPAAQERFLREARTMASIRNDHVVAIYEVDQAVNVPFLAMEFLQGQTLEQWLNSGETPPLGEILRIGRETATGLAAAQRSGLIHRDVKPANLWLEAPTGRVKILDFGLARPSDNLAALTQTGDVVGTPHYMAPEQARGERVDGRSDLFSLGVVLYRLCTGRLPFRGNTVSAVLTALALDQPTPVKALNPSLPPDLANLVMRLLEKDPTRRPHSATEVVAALREIEVHVPPGERSCPLAIDSGGVAPSVGPQALGHTPAVPVRPVRFQSPAVRRRRLFAVGILLSALLGAGVAGWAILSRATAQPDTGSPAAPMPGGTPIRLGVLYSRTGTMAISERPILDGVLLAVEEINERGGLLGRTIEVVIEDGKSDEAVFASKAEKLISKDQVSVILGCWTSASRKAVKSVVEKCDHLLLYPVSYEGMEESANVVCGGSVPNQQILPALRWSHGFLNRKRWFLVGSDSVFAHAASEVMRDEAKSLGTQVVGVEYLPCGSTEMAELIQRISKAKPDLILNTIYGDSNVAFFRALRRAGIGRERAPTLSFTLSEEELSGLTAEEITGHFAAGNYFQSTDLPRNREFLRRVEARFGPDKIVSDPMQTAYTLVHLWGQAVASAGTPDVCAVRQAIRGQRFDSPEGPVSIDPATLHTVQASRVGRINDQGRFIEEYVSPQPIVPQPFPASRDRQAWSQLLEELHHRWGGRWHNPQR